MATNRSFFFSFKKKGGGETDSTDKSNLFSYSGEYLWNYL